MLLLLACTGAEIHDTAVPDTPVTAPSGGTYNVALGDTWLGTCDLADPATHDDVAQEWTVDPRGDTLIVYLDYWSPITCTLEGFDFGCDDGSWSGGRVEVTRRVEGTFPTDARIEGALVLELDCGGAGCDTLEGQYGRGLEFPCRSEVAFEGVLAGP